MRSEEKKLGINQAASKGNKWKRKKSWIIIEESFFLKEIRTTMNMIMKVLFKKKEKIWKSGYTEFMEQPMKYTALQRIT